MKIPLECECGGYVSVTETQAGMSVRCECGRFVEVPSLGKLRHLGGGSAPANARLVIETMAANGELPATEDCAACGQPTPRIVDAWVAEGEPPPSANEWVGRLLLVVCLGWIGAVIAILSVTRRQYAEERELRLPLRLCEPCERSRLRLIPWWAFAALAVFLGVGGVALAVATEEPGFAFPAIAGVVISLVASRLIRSNQRQRAIVDLLGREPVYRRVLPDFSNARYRLAAREGSLARDVR